MSKKILYLALALVGLACLCVYLFIARPVLKQNTAFLAEKKVLYIPTGASYTQLVDSLSKDSIIGDFPSFRLTAKLMRYQEDHIRPGRYLFRKGMTNREMVGKLRSGSQDAPRVVINNIRLLSDLAGKAGRYFEADSLAFLNYLSKPETAAQYGMNQEQFLTMFIPNTYEMFWTTTPEKFVARMKKEYDNFWNDARKQALAEIKRTPTEAYILASIVEKESNYDPERPTIAGVYLNRLNVGEKLQADPTVVFATGDFSIQRVLYSHLQTDSPYNTYLNVGLPPGPICMPSIASLEAVIHAEKHDYFFFCARADNSGIHVFAKDYTSHLKNADAFSAWMNARNIK